MQAETTFNRKVGAKLKSYPQAWEFKTQEVSLRGIPDHLWCINGIMVALEGKMDEREPYKEVGRVVLQRYNLHKIRKAGGFAAFVTPQTFGQVFLQLEDFVYESEVPKGHQRKNN